MSTIYSIFLVVHILSAIAILGLLIFQWNKSPRKMPMGVLHAGLTALIAGIVMVGLFKNVHPEEVLNHTKIGIKLVVLVVILGFGYTNVKKFELKKSIWLTMIAFTVLNIAIASFWK